MSPPPLQKHTDRFEERNSFIFALLGIVSWANDSKRLGVSTNVAPVLEEGDPRLCTARTDRQRVDQALVEGLLGLVQLEQTVATIVLSWAELAAVPGPNARPVQAEGLLR